MCAVCIFQNPFKGKTVRVVLVGVCVVCFDFVVGFLCRLRRAHSPNL